MLPDLACWRSVSRSSFFCPGSSRRHHPMLGLRDFFPKLLRLLRWILHMDGMYLFWPNRGTDKETRVQSFLFRNRNRQTAPSARPLLQQQPMNP